MAVHSDQPEAEQCAQAQDGEDGGDDGPGFGHGDFFGGEYTSDAPQIKAIQTLRTDGMVVLETGVSPRIGQASRQRGGRCKIHRQRADAHFFNEANKVRSFHGLFGHT